MENKNFEIKEGARLYYKNYKCVVESIIDCPQKLVSIVCYEEVELSSYNADWYYTNGVPVEEKFLMSEREDQVFYETEFIEEGQKINVEKMFSGVFMVVKLHELRDEPHIITEYKRVLRLVDQEREKLKKLHKLEGIIQDLKAKASTVLEEERDLNNLFNEFQDTLVNIKRNIADKQKNIKIVEDQIEKNGFE